MPRGTVWFVTLTEVIEEIGTRLARAAPTYSRVVLFRSYARGEGDAGSDYDVLVIEQEVADAAEEAVRLRAELSDAPSAEAVEELAWRQHGRARVAQLHEMSVAGHDALCVDCLCKRDEIVIAWVRRRAGLYLGVSG